MTKVQTRADGLTPGAPFYAVQIFDREGYHSSIVAPTEEEVCAKLARRLASTKGLQASPPFLGTWAKTNLPDVSLPVALKAEFAALDKGRDE